MIFYIILFLIILAIVVWGGVTQWKFIKGKGKDYFENDHVIIPPVKIDFKNDVAIVGHGSISEEDRKLFNKFDTVYRMSRLLNFNKGDKLTHCIVQIRDLKNYKDSMNVLKSSGSINSIKKFYLYEMYDKFLKDYPQFKDKAEDISHLFKKIKIGDIEYENQGGGWAQGFSIGFLTIGCVIEKHPNSNIHLFGYSWFGFYLKKGEPIHKFYKWRPAPRWKEVNFNPNNHHISKDDKQLGYNWPYKEGVAIIMTSNRCIIHPINSKNAYA